MKQCHWCKKKYPNKDMMKIRRATLKQGIVDDFICKRCFLEANPNEKDEDIKEHINRKET